jgi:Spy/CpxP family protein refolding chaperone
MRKHIATFLLASSAALGLGSEALAQADHEQHARRGGPMAELRSLDLTEDQQAQVKKILDEQREAMRTLHEQTTSKIRAVLTPEQQAKFDQQVQARAGRGHK